MLTATRGRYVRVALRATALLVVCQMLSACYIFNFFQKKAGDDDSGGDVFSGVILGQTLGEKAGGLDEAALAAVYGVATSHPPAALRPDPDLFVRRLLLEYRDEGATVARQIGEVEQFRLLLGGASEDFAKMPQESYDATSLLAVHKVAEEVCRGLVAPNPWEHPGWSTILPYGGDQEADNIAWLAQRILGKPSTGIASEKLTALQAIMDAEEPFVTQNWWADGNVYVKYIPVCATLALDAEALYY